VTTRIADNSEIDVSMMEKPNMFDVDKMVKMKNEK
jgi:hypothetical protein